MKIYHGAITVTVSNQTLAASLTADASYGARELADIINQLAVCLNCRSGIEKDNLSLGGIMTIVADGLNADGRQLVKTLADAIEP